MSVGSIAFLLTFGIGVAAVAPAQDGTLSGVETSRKLFPKHWVRGYIDGAIAPPHNEPDLNRCAAWAGIDGGADAPCSAFARYVGSAYVELQPLAASAFQRVFLFWEPHVYFGRNVPQFRYSVSAIPMAYERALGVGIKLPKNFEVRLSQHGVEWLGRYAGPQGKADLGKNGPLGVYTTVAARWYFGGYNRR